MNDRGSRLKEKGKQFYQQIQQVGQQTGHRLSVFRQTLLSSYLPRFHQFRHRRPRTFKAILTVIGIFLTFLLANGLFPLRVEVNYSQIVTDRNGHILYTFLSTDEKWRLKTELSEISEQLSEAILYKEDKYFYWHPGINPLALVRAAVFNLTSGRRTSGASTITMQVARLLAPKERTYWNKMVEMFRAVQLEWQYSKSEILQLYLNLVPYGGNIEGIKSASVLFFDKTPEQLSPAKLLRCPSSPTAPLP